MAYSDDAVKSKLSSLNETQDSIVANAQWIMFHRRHADRTAALWMQKLQESPLPRRLVLIYLANEVVQQSRARGKQDFLLAFEPLIADATGVAYKGASQDAQGKVRRVTEVWRQRGIFDRRILDQVDARMAEIDKTRAGKSAGGAKLGGSLFGGGTGGSVPPELDSISKSVASLNKADITKTPAINAAEVDYARTTDASAPLPTPPVHAARLAALMKNLATAQGALEASMQARKELLSGLEELIQTNRSKLAEDEEIALELSKKRETIDMKKQEVEDAIMSGLSSNDHYNATTHSTFMDNVTNGSPELDPERPEAEGFTPPPEAEPLAQHSSPAPASDNLSQLPPSEHIQANTSIVEPMAAQSPVVDNSRPILDPSMTPPASVSASSNGVRQPSSEVPSDPRLKRRKMSHKTTEEEMSEDLFGAGGLGGAVDEDSISAMLDS
nr:upf0400 protein [Quercus suber]